MSIEYRRVFLLAVAILVFPGATLAQAEEQEAASSESHRHKAEHSPKGHSEPEVHHGTPGHATEPAHHDEAGHDHGGAGHNHATDHGQGASVPPVARFLGKFHPMVVHFPIALMLAAALSELFSLFNNEGRVAATTHYCLLLGTIGAVAAAASGWVDAWGTQYAETIAGFHVVTIHRTLGTSAAMMASVCLALSFRTCKARNSRTIALFRGALFTTAVLVGAAGHFGAMLVFGLDYFRA